MSLVLPKSVLARIQAEMYHYDTDQAACKLNYRHDDLYFAADQIKDKRQKVKDEARNKDNS